jgi:hypothetical protein
MWSKDLQELSEEHLEYDGVNVKTQKGDFGILNIDYQNKNLYYITFNRKHQKLKSNFSFCR